MLKRLPIHVRAGEFNWHVSYTEAFDRTNHFIMYTSYMHNSMIEYMYCFVTSLLAFAIGIQSL